MSFIVLGAIVVAQSQAAVYVISSEAESGSVGGVAAKTAADGASAAQAVRFGNSSQAGGTEFGFVSFGVEFDSTSSQLTKYKQDIDLMATEGIGWVRIRVNSSVVGDADSPTIQWNQAGLDVYDRAIDYAVAKGVKPYIVTVGPDVPDNMQFSEYKTTCANFWKFLAGRWKDKVSLWVLFNEVDGGHYRFNTDEDLMTANYLSELNQLYAAGRSAIKSVAPGMLITTTTDGYPIEDATLRRWYQLYDAVHAHFDVIGLDMYAGEDPEAIDAVGGYIAAVKQRYGKQVIIGEVGLPTCPTTDGCMTQESEQAKWLVPVLNNMKHEGKPMLITFFQIRDEGTDGLDAEQMFGILRYDGTKKAGYRQIVDAMR